eukprot:3463928-Pleurochrysis_carterae.AAC.1
MPTACRGRGGAGSLPQKLPLAPAPVPHKPNEKDLRRFVCAQGRGMERAALEASVRNALL